MGGQRGYNTVQDAMATADNFGTQQYWLDYRIVFVNQDGSYSYLLTNDQGWRNQFDQYGTQVIAYRSRDNSQPYGFTGWLNP